MADEKKAGKAARVEPFGASGKTGWPGNGAYYRKWLEATEAYDEAWTRLHKAALGSVDRVLESAQLLTRESLNYSMKQINLMSVLATAPLRRHLK